MSDKRLVVVSNRLPKLKTGEQWKQGKVPSSGGLVSALLPVMEMSSKGVWMGWSGKSEAEKRSGTLHEYDMPVVKLVSMDLSEKEVNTYYNGFCNRTLWPMFHGFQGRVHVNAEEQEAYFRTNEKFGKVLIDLLQPDDVVWVHDYHMVPLGRYLRRNGFTGPLGFFIHIPFPPLEMIEILPDPLGFMDAWLYYDQVGFHNDRYMENYFEVMDRLMLGVREDDTLFAGNRRQKVLACPIGIDLSIYDPQRESRSRAARRKGFRPELPGCKLVLGVDRLDYTKGVPERMNAFAYFLKHYPEWLRRVSMLQICSPSRTKVQEYKEQKELMDSTVGKINSEYAEHDWVPIRYLYRTYGQADLARFYRDADVALISPLRDGMNLIAMEYVAAQRPEAPGVPVLSRFTGIAEYLSEAVLINPYLPDSVAAGLDWALSMSLNEKKERYHAMMKFIRKNTASIWADNFINSLTKVHEENASITRPKVSSVMSPGSPSPVTGE